jgi:hypothetical protein
MYEQSKIDNVHWMSSQCVSWLSVQLIYKGLVAVATAIDLGKHTSKCWFRSINWYFTLLFLYISIDSWSCISPFYLTYVHKISLSWKFVSIRSIVTKIGHWTDEIHILSCRSSQVSERNVAIFEQAICHTF